MSERHTHLTNFDPDDPRSIGLAIVRLDGALSAMQQNASNAHLQSTQATEGMRADMRRLEDKIESLKPLAQTSLQISEEISRICRRLEVMENQRDTDRDMTTEKIAATRSRVDKIAWIAVGVSIAGSLFSGLVYKIQADNEQLREQRMIGIEKKIGSSDERLDRVEIHMAGDPARPYKR